MRQLVFRGSGEVDWQEVPDPVLPGPGGALVAPLAVSTCDLDVALLRGRAPAPPAPFALGHETVAEVVEVGDDVTTVRPGDRVSVPFQVSCGTCERCRRGHTARCRTVGGTPMYGLGAFGGDWGGTLADVVVVPFADAMLVPVPTDVPLAALASLSDNLVDGYRTVAAPLTAEPGADVLVVSGWAASIGLYAVAAARALGAGDVVFVDRDPGRRLQAERLGAVARADGDDLPRFPVTVDASGDPEGLRLALRRTAVEGTCTSAAMYFAPVDLDLFDLYVTGVRFVTGRVHARPLMPEVLDLVTTGRLDPLAVETSVVGWDEAPAALATPADKTVLCRT